MGRTLAVLMLLSGACSSGPGGAPVDGGGPLAECAPQYADCDTASVSTSHTVHFTCCEYSPPCVRIRVGESVTFSGAFPEHILATACGPSEVITRTVSGTSRTFTFTTPGRYGYFCEQHGTTDPNEPDMKGLVEVVP